MQATGAIGANGGKEVVTVEANKRILKFTTVACEKKTVSLRGREPTPTSPSLSDGAKDVAVNG